MYQLQRSSTGPIVSILRIADGACIPLDTENRDYQDYCAWRDAGNEAAEDPAYTVEALKARKNSEINQARLDANRSSFMHDGHEFACDDLSRSDIDGTAILVQMTGQFPQPWPGYWKAVDNSLYPITTKAQWDAFYISMGAAGATNFAKSQMLKAQLADATTVEQINAINWE